MGGGGGGDVQTVGEKSEGVAQTGGELGGRALTVGSGMGAVAFVAVAVDSHW